MTFTIEIRVGLNSQIFYADADTEAQALLKARAHARRTLSCTAYRFASFITC